jgi:hypothetical protein
MKTSPSSSLRRLNEGNLHRLVFNLAKERLVNCFVACATSLTYRITVVQQPVAKRKVNKVFLINTILSTESHNRKEEVEDCWRQHNLQKRQRTASFSRSDDSYIYEFERSSWALKKVILIFDAL